jgi:hypothetical protein
MPPVKDWMGLALAGVELSRRIVNANPTQRVLFINLPLETGMFWKMLMVVQH